jgi:N utilization substance protein B
MNDNQEIFPLSKKRKIKGTRRLSREKALQIIIACEVSNTPWRENFNHIFFRDFTFDEIETEPKKLLRPDEILELEADTPIDWTDEEIDFTVKLIEKVEENKDYIDNLIVRFAQNWELDRIAIIDRAIIQIAVTEFIAFEEIPTKVSINEAIDIAKQYSTEKSGIFINGILDSILDMLKSEGKIIKSGRGLIDK